MKLVGFKINKINCEKTSEKVQNLKINSSIDLPNIKEIKVENLKGNDTLVSIEFKHSLDYSPNYAKLEIGGEIIFEEQSKEAKKLIEQWRDKNILPDFKVGLFNWIIKKTSIKLLEIEEEMNLPPHINFPILKITKEKKEE